jgi:hypothetical protein
MPTRRNPAWAEILQLVPVISLALPFILAGKVDLARAGVGFLMGGLLAIPVMTAVLLRKHLLNPILVGTAAWLWLGLLAFYAPLPAVRAWLVSTQAFGLFLAALLAGIAAMLWSPWGYIAYRSTDRRWNRSRSVALLGITVVVVLWAWFFRHDIRVGGGLPFIVLNVARRILGRRAPTGSIRAPAAAVPP